MSVLSTFLQNLRNFGLEYYDRYYSTYPGVVTDVADPDQRGRIKVKVPSILGEEELVQWVIPISNPLAGSQTGAFFPPYVGDIVQVMFEHGDIDFPFYIGGFWAQGELPEAFTADYPNVRGFQFKSGQKILVNETEGKLQLSLVNANGGFIIIDDTADKEGIYIQHKNGSLMQFQKTGSIVMTTPKGNMVFLDEEEGAVTLKSAAGGLLTVKEDMTLGDQTGKNIVSFSKDSVNILADKNVNISAVNVNLEAGAINLGKGASFHAVIYENLKSIFDSHIHPTAVGPSGPALPPNTMALMELNPATSAKASSVKIKGNL